MSADRFRNLGIASVCVVLTVAAWTLRTRTNDKAPDSSVPKGELTIPVEIVEAGRAPRVREIRVSR